MQKKKYDEIQLNTIRHRDLAAGTQQGQWYNHARDERYKQPNEHSRKREINGDNHESNENDCPNLRQDRDYEESVLI